MKPMAISDPRSASSSARVIVPMRPNSKTLILAVWSDLSKVLMCDNRNQAVALSFIAPRPSGSSGGSTFEPKGCPITLFGASALGDRLRLPCFAFDAKEERLLIPAFGELTGGHECGQVYRKWLVAEGTIVPWQNPESRARKKRLVR